MLWWINRVLSRSVLSFTGLDAKQQPLFFPRRTRTVNFIVLKIITHTGKKDNIRFRNRLLRIVIFYSTVATMWKHFTNEILCEPRKWKNIARIKGIYSTKANIKYFMQIQHFNHALYTYKRDKITVSSFTHLIRKGRSILCHAGINNIYPKGLVPPSPSVCVCNKILTSMMNWWMIHVPITNFFTNENTKNCIHIR